MRTSGDRFVMDLAQRVAQQSRANNAKVGAVMVKGINVIGVGFNGTPAGWANDCEDENGITKPEVLHAESNLIAKVARSTQSSEGTTVFTTLSPCLDCAKQMFQAGVERVVYETAYRDLSGVEFLKKAGVEVEQVK